jgi:hypothetical protein
MTLTTVLTPQNQTAYDSLYVSLLDGLGTLQLLIAVCENDALQKMVAIAELHPKGFIFAGIKGEIVSEKRKYVNLPSQSQIDAIRCEPFSLIWANIIGPPSTILFPKSYVQFDSKNVRKIDTPFKYNGTHLARNDKNPIPLGSYRYYLACTYNLVIGYYFSNWQYFDVIDYCETEQG